MEASITATRHAIDDALKSTGYGCNTVSWDDVSRGTVGGSLSCWGSNITDTRLNAKDGTSLFTVRSDNWNEKLGCVDSAHVALLIGNCNKNGEKGLRNVTLHDFLNTPIANGAEYTGLEREIKLLCPEKDTKVSIRFQTVFLPVDESGKLQFATEAYNYQTKSDEDPRNLVCLATTQGLSVQADGKGSKRLILHKLGARGDIGEYWLEAEQSNHEVGGEQLETKEEREDALVREKATSEVIGIKAMGKRFNVLMTIQVPLKQSERKRRRLAMKSSRQLQVKHSKSVRRQIAVKSATALPVKQSSLGGRIKKNYGKSRAARVSRGDYHGPYPGMPITKPKRNTDEHVTVTVVLYNTVTGGVPTPKDCMAAVEDMERLYAACSESGGLADPEFDFMKNELKPSDIAEIVEKLIKHPPPQVSGNVISPPPINEHGLVKSKVTEMEGKDVIVAEDVLMLKLLTLGALKDTETKWLLARKFDTLKNVVTQSNKEESTKLFQELKQLIRGAFGTS